VLCLGSSRTLNAVDPDILGPRLSEELGGRSRRSTSDRPGRAGHRRGVRTPVNGCGVKPDVAMIEVHPVFLAGQRPDRRDAVAAADPAPPEELPLVAGSVPADDRRPRPPRRSPRGSNTAT